MNIGSTIKEVRMRKKISQAILAEECGITRTYLSLIENNKYEPNISLLKTIAKKLDVPLSAMLLVALKNDEDVPEEKREMLNEVTSEVSPAIIALLM